MLRKTVLHVIMRGTEIPGDAQRKFENLPLMQLDEQGDIAFTDEPGSLEVPIGTVLINIKHPDFVKGDPWMPDRFQSLHHALFALQILHDKMRPPIDQGLPHSEGHLDKNWDVLKRSEDLFRTLKAFNDECVRLIFAEAHRMRAVEVAAHIDELRAMAVARPLRSWMLFIARTLERRDRVLMEKAIRTVQHRLALAEMRGQATGHKGDITLTQDRIRSFLDTHQAGLANWNTELALRFRVWMEQAEKLYETSAETGIHRGAVEMLDEALSTFDQIGDAVLDAYR